MSKEDFKEAMRMFNRLLLSKSVKSKAQARERVRRRYPDFI